MAKTGYSHPKCFARELGDCSRKISREHFLSKSILELFASDNSIPLEGPAWMKGVTGKMVSIASLSSKILCQRHNSALSDIDQEMTRFVSHLTGKTNESGVRSFDGHVIEKWLLKAQEGFLASGYAHQDLKGWAASPVALDVLFGGKQMGQGSGLYFVSGRHQDQQNAVGLFPLRGPEENSMAGIAVLFSGFPFVYLPIPPWPRLIESIGRLGLHYRPRAINVRHGDVEREVRTGWNGGELVEIDVSGPYY